MPSAAVKSPSVKMVQHPRNQVEGVPAAQDQGGEPHPEHIKRLSAPQEKAYNECLLSMMKHQVTLLGSSGLGENRDLAGGGRARIFDTYPASAPAQHGVLTFNGQRVLNQKIWASRYGSMSSARLSTGT